ncbi:MAG: flavin reductase [Bacillota bacterium]
MDKSVLHKLSYGVYAVGAMDGERPCGCIVNTVIQITSSGIIAVSMNHDNYTHSLIEKEGRFSVSILSESTPGNVIGTLGFSSGRDRNKFEGLDWELYDGLPILRHGSNGYLICKVLDRAETPTHTVYLAQVTDALKGEDVRSMTYEYYRNVVKGTSPKNAPTYQEPEQKAKMQTEQKKEEKPVKYECTVCHYIYEGDITKEPDDYVCPICGVPKDMFELVQ